ncbi:uncharacterized protein LOC126898238 [Daktulosphaira vitifoliae]|uniref:uncharacterized protein LOC126898238 n=1 Tax=Daktulosphaira vitifoliae TaxID=58002 RepID=UPI0021AAF1A1|nr:uncharacterized protein LOC126898238 [Daktulosphaira vitifoliae]
MSNLEGDVDNESRKRKKGVLNTECYKRNIIKTAKVKGDEHVNWAGRNIQAKQPSTTNCGCRYNCLQSFTEDNMLQIFNHLYSFNSKTEQDIYIQSLMELEPIARPRPRSYGEKSKPKAFNVKYSIQLNGVRTVVYKKSFMQTYSYSKNQLERLSHLLQKNKTPEDKRGKGPSGNAIPESENLKVREHIESFPTKVSHYSNSERRYLAANLNQRIIYDMFVAKERDFLLAILGNEKRFSYKYFCEYFRVNYDLGFGRPVVDACVTCEELQTKIKNPTLNDNAKKVAVAELMVHKRKAKKFYEKHTNEKNLTWEETKVELANKIKT